MWLVMLQMRWTNLVPIFYNNVCHILQPEILTYTVPYIDNVPVKGPSTHYLLQDGFCKTFPANSGIQCFIWEYFQNINCIIQCMKYSGGTFLGTKSMLCIENFIIIGHYCMPDGRKPDSGRVDAIGALVIPFLKFVLFLAQLVSCAFIFETMHIAFMLWTSLCTKTFPSNGAQSRLLCKTMSNKQTWLPCA